jgi:ATPase subunit of ABC transporter with duplicated ATPase domains
LQKARFWSTHLLTSIIAEALNKYTGAMIMVSHVPDFVEKIRIDEVLDLGK